jgi:hypothetical protein
VARGHLTGGGGGVDDGGQVRGVAGQNAAEVFLPDQAGPGDRDLNAR